MGRERCGGSGGAGAMGRDWRWGGSGVAQEVGREQRPGAPSTHAAAPHQSATYNGYTCYNDCTCASSSFAWSSS